MPSACSACGKTISSKYFMECVSCTFLYDIDCLNIKIATFEKQTDTYRKQWICPTCSSSRPKVSDTSTPIRALNQSISTANVNVMRGSRGKQASDAPVNSMAAGLSEVVEEIRLLRQDILDVKSQLSIVSTTFGERMKEYENRLVSKDIEINSLKSLVTELQQAIAVNGQYNLRNELEIIGIPEQSVENLTHTILVTSKKLGVDLLESDIDQVVRVGSKQKFTSSEISRPVVVKLIRKSKRDELLSAAAKRRGITSSDIVSGTSNVLYFNERLTAINRKLFGEARRRATLHNFRYCWVRNGQIYVRKASSTKNTRHPAIVIHSSEDIEKHIGPASQAEEIGNETFRA